MAVPARRIGAASTRALIVLLLVTAAGLAVPSQALFRALTNLAHPLAAADIPWAAGGALLLALALLLETLKWFRRCRAATAQLAESQQTLLREAERQKRAESRLVRQTSLLAQRIREINCLYALSKVFTEPGLSWEDACRRTMELLPRYFHDRNRVSARLVFRGREFRTAVFRDHDIAVSRQIFIEGMVAGEIQFIYTDRRDPEYRLLFLGRERNLLDEIAGRLSNFFERRLAEERVNAARLEAERASMAKSRFFAAASHDLRQPLQAMHLFLHTLSQRLSEAEDTRVLDHLAQALDHTDELLRPLLEVAKLDAGTITPERAAFSAADLLAETVRKHCHAALDKRLHLVTVRSTVVLWSDPILLGRILDCLVGNAITHTESGRVIVGLRRRGGNARIEVWDTGPGIADSHTSAVFQEFYQVGNEERDRRHGLGLGLAIAERTARLLDHTIGLQSVLGKGSVFYVEVPMAGREQVPEWLGAGRWTRDVA